MGKEKRRKKRRKLVIPFLNVETIGVNGVDTLDPHLFSAETDRFPTVSKRLDSLQLASASMPCKIMSEMEWLGRLKCWPTGVSSFWVLTVDLLTIETFLKWVLRLTDILNTTYPARYQINYVRSGTSNVAPDLVVGTSGVTLEGVRLQDTCMFLTGNTSRSAPKHSMLDGRNGTVISGRDLSSDEEVPQARGRLKAIIGSSGIARWRRSEVWRIWWLALVIWRMGGW